MIITPDLRHSAAFLIQEDKSETVRPMASAFFVAVNIKGYLYSYLVTARHNLEYAKKDKPLFVRINTTKKKYSDLPISIDQFIQHWSSDVAITPISIPVGIFGAFVSEDMLLRADQLKKKPLNEGAEVCIPSLFSQFSGTNTMYPILRSGRIALVPEEKISAQLGPQQWQDIEGYLIECLSWGGCSGAPVFVDYFDPVAARKDARRARPTRLLGLISGHFDEPKEIEHPDTEEVLSVPLNSGIALVVPAQGIVELLDFDKETRAARFEEFLASKQPAVSSST